MVAFVIKATNFEFDGRPFSEAFNKAVSRLFREAARAFYKAAIVKIPVRTGFVKGAFGLLGDLIGETNQGRNATTSNIKKLHELKKKIEHIEKKVEVAKEYESGVRKHEEKIEQIREVNRSGIVQEAKGSESIATQGSKKGKASIKQDSASGEEDYQKIAEGRAKFEKGESEASRRAKGLYKLLNSESYYNAEDVKAFEEKLRLDAETKREKVQEIYKKTIESEKKKQYTKQRERLEKRVFQLKRTATRLSKNLRKNTTSEGRGTLAVLEALRRSATIEKPVSFGFTGKVGIGDVKGPVSENKKLSFKELREKLKAGSAKNKSAGTVEQARKLNPNELRRQYLKNKRAEALGVKSGDKAALRKAKNERKKSGQAPVEFYHAPDGTVTLKTLSSGRNFATVSLPDEQSFKKIDLKGSHSKNIGLINVNEPGAPVNLVQGGHTSTVTLPNEYVFQFGIDISYFNIADTNSTKYTPSAPWQAMVTGRLAFQKYILANYTRIPNIVTFLMETEYELQANGTITKRERRIV